MGGWRGVDVVWQFNPDGTGWYQQLAGFSPPDAERPIIWKLVGPFTIKIKELPPPSEDDDEELYPWIQVRYDFEWIYYFGRRELVMADVYSDEVLNDGFGLELFPCFPPGPITYSGPNEIIN